VNQEYTSIAGAIGMARLAHNKLDTVLENSVVNDITAGFTAGKNFSQYATNAFTAFQFDGGEGWRDYMWNGMFLGFQFLDITPEIGRYFISDSTLKAAIIGSSETDKYSLKRVEYYWPLWYMAQAPFSTVYFGEGSGVPPDAKAMVFPLKAWVQKETATKLRTYLDVPDALLGDYYYLQNLVRTIEASGQECWQDVRSTTSPCSSGTTPTTIKKLGDANNDNLVNGQDYVVWLNHYGATTTNGATDGDFTGDTLVNGQDYILWLNNYGR
jgi:hypothetical protein